MLIIFGSERVLFEVFVDRCSDGNEIVESRLVMIEKCKCRLSVPLIICMCLLLPRALVSGPRQFAEAQHPFTSGYFSHMS